MLVCDVNRAQPLCAAILLSPSDCLGRLPTNKINDIIWNQRAVARTGNGGLNIVGLGRVPGGATEECGCVAGEDGERISSDALGLERPVHGEALSTAAGWWWIL